MAKHLTIREAKAIVNALDLSFRTIPDWNEFRVNIRPENGGTEDTAYYTSDLLDAVHTAEAMHRWATGKSVLDADTFNAAAAHPDAANAYAAFASVEMEG